MLTTISKTVRSPYVCSPFSSKPCKNGGRCLQTLHGYQCLCNEGYTGAFCEMSKLENLFYYFFSFFFYFLRY
jgi:hypothetical protein